MRNDAAFFFLTRQTNLWAIDAHQRVLQATDAGSACSRDLDSHARGYLRLISGADFGSLVVCIGQDFSWRWHALD